MDYHYFEDFAVGDAMEAEGTPLTEAEIIAFAQAFDPQPMHTDPQAAEQITGGLIASGWHTASLTMAMWINGRSFTIAPGTVGLGVDHLRWRQPVRPGDTLRLRGEVTVARGSSSRPDQGILTTHMVTRNQRGEVVLELTTSAIVPKRNP